MKTLIGLATTLSVLTYQTAVQINWYKDFRHQLKELKGNLQLKPMEKAKVIA